jgi:hypothetical protein
MGYIKPYVVIFGGISKKAIPTNDLWIINIHKEPYNWESITQNLNAP